MFGIDAEKTKVLQARLDWLSLCASLIVKRLSEALNLKLPPPPPEAKL